MMNVITKLTSVDLDQGYLVAMINDKNNVVKHLIENHRDLIPMEVVSLIFEDLFRF